MTARPFTYVADAANVGKTGCDRSIVMPRRMPLEGRLDRASIHDRGNVAKHPKSVQPFAAIFAGLNAATAVAACNSVRTIVQAAVLL